MVPLLILFAAAIVVVTPMIGFCLASRKHEKRVKKILHKWFDENGDCGFSHGGSGPCENRDCPTAYAFFYHGSGGPDLM